MIYRVLMAMGSMKEEAAHGVESAEISGIHIGLVAELLVQQINSCKTLFLRIKKKVAACMLYLLPALISARSFFSLGFCFLA